MIVSDHQTCVESRTHAAGPVPFLIYDRRKEQKGPKKFSEKTAGLSGRFIEKGYELMDAFIKEGTK